MYGINLLSLTIELFLIKLTEPRTLFQDNNSNIINSNWQMWSSVFACAGLIFSITVRNQIIISKAVLHIPHSYMRAESRKQAQNNYFCLK